MLKEKFEKLLAETLKAVQSHYRERLVTLAVFGSVARRTQRPDSDIDLLLICEKLPPGRMRRVKEFEKVERRLAPLLLSLSREGFRHSCPRPSRLQPRSNEEACSILIWWMMPAFSTIGMISSKTFRTGCAGGSASLGPAGPGAGTHGTGTSNPTSRLAMCLNYDE